MFKLQTPHLLTGDELSADEIHALIHLACKLKTHRTQPNTALQHQHLALIFDKPSLRTRFSFTVAMHELGGHIVESVQTLRKQETPEDTMRVIQGYCHGVMIRTFADSILTQMQAVATIPMINGLSDSYHPCQILADLMTLKQQFSELSGLTLCYIGDGNNILHSLLLMVPKLGIRLHYCCPKDNGPDGVILKKAQQAAPADSLHGYNDPVHAVADCDAVYTDVWTSMGFTPKAEHSFRGFQVNETLMANAKTGAIFMHCMPIERGLEVSTTLPDADNSVIFQQSENRLHVQKALLLALLG